MILILINTWLFILISCSYMLVRKIIISKDRKDIFKRYGEILVILDGAKELAYKKVYQDHVLTYSFSGFKLNKEELDKFQSIYIKTIFTFCGPNIIEDLKKIHGDIDSICAILANDFIQRVKVDESDITGRISDIQDDKTEGIING